MKLINVIPFNLSCLIKCLVGLKLDGISFSAIAVFNRWMLDDASGRCFINLLKICSIYNFFMYYVGCFQYDNFNFY